ncbi:transcriptional regulator [Gallibacterium salpingitidis]|uniref:HTH-type transcriptional regulatory protein TyrR n=2 Tax=Gallibacterium salpingitidis TaxID=505341 RepID=A0A1A7NSG8_9PAST|nr:transcriptional regulator [Gallibacterium salpingitidis]
MRFAIACVDRIGVAKEVLDLLAKEQINLEGIELKKVDKNGFIYLKIEDIAAFQTEYLIDKLRDIAGVSAVSRLDYLPYERKAIELNALFESLPHPILSIDLAGKIEFANQLASKLLLPYLQEKKPKALSLQNSLLADALPLLQQATWYKDFLQQSQQDHLSIALSHQIQLDDQQWRMDVLPLTFKETDQVFVGSVVTLQSFDMLRIDPQQFNAYHSNTFAEVVAKSRKMAELVELAKKFAFSDAPLLIQGETGTGKEFIAKACHNLSNRRDQKFIAVNCAGLPPEDTEAEMFGYHTNERQSIGFFEYADQGTVLLDNIAELSLPMQAKLLRFLHDGTFRRVGEEQEHYVNVRVICTTQEPLSTYVEQGVLREDLYHRLNVLALTIPPLRERQEDIPGLVAQFVKHIAAELGIPQPHYSTEFIAFLQKYAWAGNVRELYNALYRACSLVENGQLQIAGLHLQDRIISNFNLEQFEGATLEEMLGRFEAAILQKFYAEYPSTRKLAQHLGISHTAIANKLRQYGITK